MENELPGKVQGLRQELHEGRGGAAGFQEFFQETRGASVPFAELREKSEVLVFQIFDQLVVRRITLGRPLELVAFQGAMFLEGLVRQDGFPLFGMVDQVIPDLAQDRRFRMPDASAGKNLRRGEM